MLISIEPCTLRALFGSHNIVKNVCSGHMYIILYQTFVPLSRGKMQDVYFSAHHLWESVLFWSLNRLSTKTKRRLAEQYNIHCRRFVVTIIMMNDGVGLSAPIREKGCHDFPTAFDFSY